MSVSMRKPHAAETGTRRLAIIIAGACLAVGACASAPKASGPSSTSPPTTTQTTVAPSTTTSTAVAQGTATSTVPCVGLSICTRAPPDAEGNPACYYRDGWAPDVSGTAIEVYYFREPQNLSKPEQVTADIRMKDGTVASQIAQIDAGEQVHQIEFPSIDRSVVQEVLLTTSGGRCFVTGPSVG